MLSERYGFDVELKEFDVELKEFDVELWEFDFRGRRWCLKDRYADAVWTPKEKCVDIATISNLF